VFPCYEVGPDGHCSCWEGSQCDRPGKHPRWERDTLEHGHKDATTDEEQIRQWWEKHPDANVASPTGGVSDTLAVDHDLYKPEAITLEELERKLGAVSRTGITIETGSGGRQYLFRYPKGSNIRNTTGLLPGVDIRGEGGYILLEPSTTQGAYRRLDNRTLTDPPAQLVERLTEPNRTGSRGTGGTTSEATPITANLDGPPILKGTRDDTLTRIAGKRHDGTRSLDRLTAELLAINARRCEPPLPDQEVVKVACSIHRREPCKPGRPKELDDMIEALSDFWHTETWKGIAGKSEARFARALIREGRKVGTLVDGSLSVERSHRQMAEILGVHRNTVGNIAKRGQRDGWLRYKSPNPREGRSGVFILVEARQVCATSNHGGVLGRRTDGRGGGTSLSRPSYASRKSPANAADLTTEHYRYRGHVAYSKEHTLCTFEAHGAMNREQAAAVLQWSRPRDLERLHLDPLCELGLLEKHGDTYAIPADYPERQQRVRGEAFSTVQERVSRERSAEGRNVYVIRESGMVASEAERAKLQREKHARERELFRNRGKELSTPTTEVSEASREAIRRSHDARDAALAEEVARPKKAVYLHALTDEQREIVQQRVREGMRRDFAIESVVRLTTKHRTAKPEPQRKPGRKMPRMVKGVYVHGAVCECEWCAEDLEPRYACARRSA
jgi:hypothetical protein